MNATEILNKWKQGEQDPAAIQNVAGIAVVDEALLGQVNGGWFHGRIYSISAECNGGTRCDIFSLFER